MSRPATKREINTVIREITGHMKVKVHAQGTLRTTRYEARNRTSIGSHAHTRTLMTKNGRFLVTAWGRDAEQVAGQMAAGFAERGYTVEGVAGAEFQVHNGTVLPLEGALRWEGTY